MSERVENLETLRMALEIMRELSPVKPIDSATLMQRLEARGIKRSQRSVQRTLGMLVEHFDIECDTRSKPYGYRWRTQSKEFSVRSLSESDSLMLLLAEQHLKNLMPTKMLKAMEGFFEQAHRKVAPAIASLSEDEATRLSAQWLDKVRIVSATQPLLPPQIDEAVLEAVSSALYANKWLNIEYRNQTQQAKSAYVMPLGIAQQGVRLYLVCRFEGYDNERTLAVNRITAATVSSKPFERPADFDLDKYDEDGRFASSEGPRVQLSFKISKKAGLHLTESPLSKDQTIEDCGDHYAVSAPLQDTLRLRQWLQGFGGEVWGVGIVAIHE